MNAAQARPDRLGWMGPARALEKVSRLILELFDTASGVSRPRHRPASPARRGAGRILDEAAPGVLERLDRQIAIPVAGFGGDNGGM